MSTSSSTPFMMARPMRTGMVHQLAAKLAGATWVLMPMATANR